MQSHRPAEDFIQDGGNPPLFIVGFQRSGTTLLRLMLDNHPEVAIPLDVVGLWSRFESRLGRYGPLAALDAKRALISDLLAEERIQLWAAELNIAEVLGFCRRTGYEGIIEAFYLAYAHGQGKRYWGDKDPGNMRRLHQINRWFPDSRIIHLIRDGRDACHSQLEQPFGFGDLLPCAVAWREEVWWVRCIGQILGAERYLEVKYEDLVRRPAAELKRVCTFLNLEYSDEMLDYHRHTERSIPASKRHIWKLIGMPPQADRIGRWKEFLSRGERVAFEKRAGDLLSSLGYEVLTGTPSGGYLAEMRTFFRMARAALIRRVGR